MHTLKTPEGEFSTFDICQAHLQLESDYNVGGILRERPSNERRNASTGVQLARMRYSPGMRWVDLVNEEEEREGEDSCDADVRFIYFSNVLKWDLPIDAEQAEAIERIFTSDALEPYSERLEAAKSTGHWGPGDATNSPTSQP